MSGMTRHAIALSCHGWFMRRETMPNKGFDNLQNGDLYCSHFEAVSCRNRFVALLGIWTIFFGIQLFGQSQKEYIYLDGKLVATELSTSNLPAHAKSNDYDGDSKADYVLWRADNNTWYIDYSAGTYTSVQWGGSIDDLVPADYDGDGKTDIAYRRPSTNVWNILPSSAPGTNTIIQFGESGDIPVPGYYDNDRKADIAVWRPSTGVWWILPSSNPALMSHTLGSIHRYARTQRLRWRRQIGHSSMETQQRDMVHPA